jgi:hypothetical protein
MSGLQSGINAELVFQLMGVAGIDLSIVNSLLPDEIADTDRLLLTSLQNDLAVLDWRDPDDTLGALQSVGLSGVRAPHPLDPSAPPVAPGMRRFYIVDLRRGDQPAIVAESMKQLLGQRRVVAIPLGIGLNAKAQPKSTPQPVPGPPQAAKHGDESSGEATPRKAETPGILRSFAATDEPVLPPAPNVAKPPASGAIKAADSSPSETDLDALVDGLNAADW